MFTILTVASKNKFKLKLFKFLERLMFRGIKYQ